MAKGFRYSKEDVLKEMAEALNQTEPKTAQPNAIRELLMKAKLGKK